MISVIIPSHNRANLLAQTLDSLEKQCLPKDEFEIIIINNGGYHTVKKVIDSYKKKLKNIVSLENADRSLHSGRHLGLKTAVGEILVFADDDIEALPTWLLAIKEAFLDPKVAMVGGNNYPMYMSKPPKWLLKLWDRRNVSGLKYIQELSVLEFVNPPIELSPFFIWGCNFSIRKKILIDAGGFHPDGMPSELIQFRGDGETHVSRYVAANQLKCVFQHGASVYHKVTKERMTFEYFRNQGFKSGVSESYNLLRNRNFDISENNYSKRYKYYLNYFRIMVSGFFNPDLKKVTLEIRSGYREGFAFHQNSYKKNKDLQNWVHKENYY